MQALGIIGGSGLCQLDALKIECHESVKTPYGEPSAPQSGWVSGASKWLGLGAS